MDLQLTGKRAVVTGGSRGIGKAIALQLAREGCDVAICARTEGPLREAAAEIARATGRKVVPITADTRDGESVKVFIDRAAAELGGIDILVNNAARLGGSIPEGFETIDDKQVLADLEEKVVGYFRCARAAAPYMKQAGWGRIISVSGGAGRNPGQNVGAGVRNSAVINLNKAMANALGPFGINCIAIYPGQTMTEVTTEMARQRAEREGKTLDQVLAEMTERTVNRHLVTAEEIAYVVAFLASPLAVSITGEAIAVNGGASPDVHF